MAVIQKIRNKYGKIAGGVIGVALISFIISDARNGSFGRLFGGNGTDVMTVNGNAIEAKEYEKRVKEYETLTNIYSNRGPLDDAARAQIREQVLQSISYETIVSGICDKMGITTSEQEAKDLIYSPNAHPLVKQFQFQGQQVFNNPETKQFDPARVKGYEDEIAKNPKVDPTGTFMENWNAVKGYVIRNSRIDKFNTMMSAGAYAPMYQAKRSVANGDMMASIRYIKVPFTTIPDDQAKVTDEDIKAYMQKHKAMFETDQATRTIDYVSFDIIPSSADSSRATGALNEIKEEFSKAKDDKTYVGNKSDDINTFNEAYVNSKNFGSRFADTIMKEPVGSIYGPYLENGSFRITKMIDKKVLPDSVKVRQILIRTNDGKTAIREDSTVKARMDSIATAIKNGTPFDSMLAKYSEDYNPQNPKGEIPVTLAVRPQLSKEFGDFIFEGKTGEKKVVKADNSKTGGYTGYHYIEILEQTAVGSTVKVATITKSLVPSDSTVNAIFGRANEFAAKSTNAAEFDANVKKMGVDKRVGENIKESNFTIQGLGGAREIIKWMYGAKVGEVSKDPFRLNDQRYVVAKLVSADEKGMTAITAANRPMLEQRVRDEKKAALIAAKYKGATLESIAAGAGAAVQQSDSVMLGASFVPGLGYEPKVVGYAFCQSFQPNTVSPAIKGQGGVYFISVNNRVARPAPDQMTMQMGIMQQRQQEEGQLRGYLGQMLQQTLTKKADIKYNIANF